MRNFEHSFQAKLAWAHQHMDALRQRIITFGLSKPCVVVHDFEHKGLKHIWRVNGEVAIPPQEISLRLGDTLYNYRGVLDHLARDLVIASKGKPTGKTAFPLCREPEDWNSDRVRSQLAGMEETVRARIEQLQPYHGRQLSSTNYLLGLLNSLGNVEKHRHFNLITASVDLATFSVDEGILTDYFIHLGPIEDGTVLARAHGHVDVNFIAAFGVAVGERGAAIGIPVQELVLRIELAVQAVLTNLAWFALDK